MLSLAKFIEQLKRKTRYGTVSDTTDQITEDIVFYTNERLLRLWRRHPWDWSILEFTLALVSGTKDYTLSALLGDIIAIDNGAGGYFVRRSLKRYLQWHKSASTSGLDSGAPSDYVRMGLDASKAIKIKVWPTPSTTVNRTGWGKKRLTRYTVADIATNTDLAYFPEEYYNVIFTGVLADIYEAQGKAADSDSKNAYFNNAMDKMVADATIKEDSEEKSPAPDYMIWHRRKRGGTVIT